MRITLIGKPALSLLEDFAAADIAYEMRLPPMGKVMNAGIGIDLAATAATLTAIVSVMRAWLKARSSRKLVITTKDYKIFHAEGYSVAEIERLLPNAMDISMFDTGRSDDMPSADPEADQ